MADISYTDGVHASGATKIGALGRMRLAMSAFGSRLVKARMQEAERHIAYHLLALDDETLAEMGVDRETLKSKDPMPRYF